MCEKQLTQLENDIKRLSVKGPIFVVDDGAAPAAATGKGHTAGGAGSGR